MYLHSAELACEKAVGALWQRSGKRIIPEFFPPLGELDRRLGGAKLSGSDREYKYFAVGMNAREP